jgi:NAD(P)-dependent dehydrogenase (short-subunit alcohol dehydrogenase family)
MFTTADGLCRAGSGRVGTIEDVADAVLFLVSERATYINGAALVVDGSKSAVI